MIKKIEYEYLERCGFSDDDSNVCGEPAIVYAWWDSHSNGIHLCQEHFDMVIDESEEDIDVDDIEYIEDIDID